MMDSNPDPEYFMRQALGQAEKALEVDEVPVGVVIVHKNQVIAKAYNQTNLLKDPTAHAEILAITQAAAYFKHERLLDTELYSTIEPCPMCLGAIIQARIPKIFMSSSSVTMILKNPSVFRMAMALSIQE